MLFKREAFILFTAIIIALALGGCSSLLVSQGGGGPSINHISGQVELGTYTANQVSIELIDTQTEAKVEAVNPDAKGYFVFSKDEANKEYQVLALTTDSLKGTAVIYRPASLGVSSAFNKYRIADNSNNDGNADSNTDNGNHYGWYKFSDQYWTAELYLGVLNLLDRGSISGKVQLYDLDDPTLQLTDNSGNF